MVQITFSVQARQPFSLVKNQLASGSLQASFMTNVMGGVVDKSSSELSSDSTTPQKVKLRDFQIKNYPM
jgi:hypothetical protein